MRICDSHFHVGEFAKKDNTPWEILRLVRDLGLERAAVSSTTTCRYPPKALSEMKKLVRYGRGRILPVLWITQWMIDIGYVEDALASGVAWRCLKVHGDFEPGVWNSESEYMNDVIGIARERGIPVLCHTGHSPSAHAGLYDEAARCNPDVKFILAHGAPLDEVCGLLHLPNVFADTALMPMEHIKALVDEGYASKVLWGTDSPMDRPFAKWCSPAKYCRKRLDWFFHAVTDPEARRMILHDNFERLFG